MYDRLPQIIHPDIHLSSIALPFQTLSRMEFMVVDKITNSRAFRGINFALTMMPQI